MNVDPTVYAGLSATYTPPDLVSAEASLGVRANLNAGMSITAVDDSFLPAFEPIPLFHEFWSWSYPKPLPDDPLVITKQPEDVTVRRGGTLRLSVETNHSDEVAYQWSKDGRRLLDDGSELIRYGASAGTAGGYQVKVRRGEGEPVNSEVATVTIGSGGPAPAGFVWIPSGNFEMGDSLDEQKDAPVHTVYLSGFFVQITEVSKAQWDKVARWAETNGYDISPGSASAKAADHPASNVTWYECVKWCNAKSEKEGLSPCYLVDEQPYRAGRRDPDCDFSANGYRLPTEAEWEKTSRGGLSGRRFPWGNTITHNYANYSSSSAQPYDLSLTRGYHPVYNEGGTGYTAPVGSFPANRYGIYDLSGNVWEWCWDWYDASYYNRSEQTNPRGPISGTYRTCRGGSWGYGHSEFCRVGTRGGLLPSDRFPGNRNHNWGFRPVRR